MNLGSCVIFAAIGMTPDQIWFLKSAEFSEKLHYKKKRSLPSNSSIIISEIVFTPMFRKIICRHFRRHDPILDDQITYILVFILPIFFLDVLFGIFYRAYHVPSVKHFWSLRIHVFLSSCVLFFVFATVTGQRECWMGWSQFFIWPTLILFIFRLPSQICSPWRKISSFHNINERVEWHHVPIRFFLCCNL